MGSGASTPSDNSAQRQKLQDQINSIQSDMNRPREVGRRTDGSGDGVRYRQEDRLRQLQGDLHSLQSEQSRIDQAKKSIEAERIKAAQQAEQERIAERIAEAKREAQRNAEKMAEQARASERERIRNNYTPEQRNRDQKLLADAMKEDPNLVKQFYNDYPLSDYTAGLNARKANQKSENGDTKLHTAVKKGQIAVCRFLLEKCGADVNAGDINGIPPIVPAITTGNIEICDLFLNEHKANPYYRYCDDRDRSHIISMAAGNRKNGEEILGIVLKACGTSAINIKDHIGETPLHRAVRTLGDSEINMFLLLINNGANCFTQNRIGYNALDIAKEDRMDATITLLEQKMGIIPSSTTSSAQGSSVVDKSKKR